MTGRSTPNLFPAPDGKSYRLFGGIGSPYTMKLRAVLRYRRIPHVFHLIDNAAAEYTASVKPAIIPVLEYPEGGFAIDSTPIIEALEERHPGARSIVPADPAQAFLAWLIEDFADEWTTKWMFHYRWRYDDDAELLSRQLAFDRFRNAGEATLKENADWFAKRQIDRLALVGCANENIRIIEHTFHEVIGALNEHLANDRPFLFGSAPTVADFGLFGQLSQLQKDPTPATQMQRAAPFTHRWVDWMDDASGFEGMIDALSATPAIDKILKLVSELYLPFLSANATATLAGEKSFTVNYEEFEHRQAPFRYQVKCLERLKARFQTLSQKERNAVARRLSNDQAVRILEQD